MLSAPVRTTVVGLLVVSLGVLFAGCASIISEHTMEVWMDAHYTDLIDSWGRRSESLMTARAGR